MIEKLQENWDEVLLYMKEEHEIMDISFKTWLLPLKVHHVEHNTATIVVPDSNMISYIRKKYGLPLEVSIAEKLGFECKLNFISKEEIESSALPAENLLIKKNSNWYLALISLPIISLFKFSLRKIKNNTTEAFII